MQQLTATIESLEGNYSAFIQDLDGVVATGSTIEEIKANLLDVVDDYVETCKELGCELPESCSPFMKAFSPKLALKG